MSDVLSVWKLSKFKLYWSNQIQTNLWVMLNCLFSVKLFTGLGKHLKLHNCLFCAYFTVLTFLAICKSAQEGQWEASITPPDLSRPVKFSVRLSCDHLNKIIASYWLLDKVIVMLAAQWPSEAKGLDGGLWLVVRG